MNYNLTVLTCNETSGASTKQEECAKRKGSHIQRAHESIAKKKVIFYKCQVIRAYWSE